MHNASFLIVDDCATIRLVISSIIRNNLGSKNIFVAADGENACEIMKNHSVDFVILDWDMPVMGGERLLPFVRNDLDLKELPFMGVNVTLARHREDSSPMFANFAMSLLASISML